MSNFDDISFFLDNNIPGFIHMLGEVFINDKQDKKNLSDIAIQIIQHQQKVMLDYVEDKCLFYRFDYENSKSKENSYIQFDNLDLSKNYIFDVNQEGYSDQQLPMAKYLHTNFSKYKFDLSKVFYITGNLKEQETYYRWVANNNFTESINIIELCSWDTYRYLESDGVDYKSRRIENIDKTYIDNKFYINLNRRTRRNRSYLVYKLFEQNLQNFGIISHDWLDCDITNYFKSIGVEDHELNSIKSWVKNNLPIIADTKDFETNWANEVCDDVHSKALFSLVGETMQENFSNTSLFYSEKTFRPILLGQPFLIWGQVDCHKHLQKKLGYKPYNKLFDYSFDRIHDNKERAIALVKEVKRICELLSSMTREEQINWSLQDMDVIEYNLKRLRYNDFTMNNFLNMLVKLGFNRFDEIEKLY